MSEFKHFKQVEPLELQKCIRPVAQLIDCDDLRVYMVAFSYTQALALRDWLNAALGEPSQEGP